MIVRFVSTGQYLCGFTGHFSRFTPVRIWVPPLSYGLKKAHFLVLSGQVCGRLAQRRQKTLQAWVLGIGASPRENLPRPVRLPGVRPPAHLGTGAGRRRWHSPPCGCAAPALPRPSGCSGSGEPPGSRVPAAAAPAEFFGRRCQAMPERDTAADHRGRCHRPAPASGSSASGTSG